jgi:hypothetical protein
MTEYSNENRGVLFKNDQGGNPKRPQYRGSLNVAGQDFNISAWVKESKKDGSKFLSISVEPKKDAPRKPQVQAAEPEFADDIPF